MLDELATPLESDTLYELQWYFERRRELGEAAADSQQDRYQPAQVKFSMPRFRALYRQWSDLGDGVLESRDYGS